MRFAWLVLVSCWSAPPPPPPAKPVVPVDDGPVLAKALAGPFASIAAYCDTRPQGEDRECRVIDQEIDSATTIASPLIELAIVYATRQPPVSHCAIALRTTAGWFVSPTSTDACREPGYIELRYVRAEVRGQVVVVNLDVNWHTRGNRGPDAGSADYTLTAFCGIGANAPVCTKLFTSKCEAQAPAADCATRGYEATWKLDGKMLTIDTQPRSDDRNVPHGTHRLF